MTLRDEAAKLIQMEGATHPTGQSGFVEDAVEFITLNRDEFRDFINKKKETGSS